MDTQAVRIHQTLLEEILVQPGPQAMPSAVDLGLLELEELRHLCAGETEHFFRRLDHDSRYCFELFRRAIVARDQGAWECIYSQYLPLVRGWIHRHSLSASLQEEPQFLANRVFERMWAGVPPQKFANFPELRSILRYLQMCVNAVLVDAMRSREQANLLEEDASSVLQPKGSDRRPLEDTVLRKTQAERLWALLEARCKDEKDRCVLRGMFVNALKARELYDANRVLFQDVQEIYRVKENLLARLQRDQELAAYLEKL
jgi:hypothetical protein